MEMEFVTEDNVRKMLQIYHVFQQIPYGLKSVPMILGRQFYDSYLIYRKTTTDDDPNEMFEEVINASKSADLKSDRVSNLLNELNKVKLGILPASDPFFKTIEKGIGTELKKREGKISIYLKSIFGFSMPRKLIIILAENHSPHSSSGYGMTPKERDVCMAGYLLSEERLKDFKGHSSVIIHEMLHSMLSRSKTIKDSSGDMFMESLFDYFVPDGMLAGRLGLVKTQTVKEYMEHNNDQRPEAKEMAVKLLPAMEEYEKVFGKERIWSFLAKRGFRKYIYKRS